MSGGLDPGGGPSPSLGRTVVAGPRTSGLAGRGVRRWAAEAGVDDVEVAELLDMLGLDEDLE